MNKKAASRSSKQPLSQSWRRLDFVLGRLSTIYGADGVSQQRALQIERHLDLVLQASLSGPKTPEAEFIAAAFQLVEGRSISKPRE